MDGKKKRKQRITRADLAVIGGCLLAAAVLSVWFGFGKREARTLRISWEGATMKNLALPLEREGRKKDIYGPDGIAYCLMRYTEGGILFTWHAQRPDQITSTWEKSYNLLAISEDQVWMEAADCRDQVCVHHVPISDGADPIICLPNRLVAEIVNDADGELFDGWVQ